MSEIGAGESNVEFNSHSHERLPPLGIRHLLMFTTGIAIALAINNAIIGESPMWFTIGLFARNVVEGAGGAFLLWLGIRIYRGQSALLPDPGAQFAVVISAAAIIDWVCFLALMFFVDFNGGPPFPSIFILSIFPPLAVFIVGFIWIKDRVWRVIVVSQALTTMFCLFPFSSAAGGVALVYFLMQDSRSKQPRHWTHWFGVVLWVFALIGLL